MTAVIWEPRWIVDIGQGSECGLTIDDGCFVVLYRHQGNWRPGNHIPKQVAAKIAELADCPDLK